MKCGKFELEDWYDTANGPCRYSTNYSSEVDACVLIVREYVDHPTYNWAWKPMFNHKLYFLNKVFYESHGSYIYGTSENAKKIIDKFLQRINNLKVYW